MNNPIKNIKRLMIRLHKRYKPFTTTLPGFACRVIDKSSFLSMYDEIFERELYRFDAGKPDPYIIDVGANIGLSVAYFKKLYPSAEIAVFEPDPSVFATLEKNVAELGLDKITLIQKGLGGRETRASFFSEKSDGGRIATVHDRHDIITVEITRLSPYLNKEVDFLKIDAEGTELEILEECRASLGNVVRMFVEYHSLSSKPQTLDRILAIISEAGFRYYVERGGVYSQYPFVAIQHNLDYDCQLNIFAYREHHEQR